MQTWKILSVVLMVWGTTTFAVDTYFDQETGLTFKYIGHITHASALNECAELDAVLPSYNDAISYEVITRLFNSPLGPQLSLGDVDRVMWMEDTADKKCDAAVRYESGKAINTWHGYCGCRYATVCVY